MRPGRRNLITDVAGIMVGQAEDHRIRTGVTVLSAAAPFTAGVHVMGGAPGTRDTALLAPDKLVQKVEALVLSGGSVYGLDAASGVAEAMRAEGRGFVFGDIAVPVTPGAVIFDLVNGGDKDWPVNPYPALGKSAYAARGEEFALGSHGAGTGGRAGTLKGGTGSASLVLESGLTVGALVAVNSVGGVVGDRAGRFHAAPFEFGEEFGGMGAPQEHDPGREPERPGVGENTAIAIVATDAALTKAEATRMATAAHDGIARAILPSHTPHDGDLVFAVSTGQRPMADPALDPMLLGHAAAVALSRAVARAVWEAEARPGDLLPTWRSRFG